MSRPHTLGALARALVRETIEADIEMQLLQRETWREMARHYPSVVLGAKEAEARASLGPIEVAEGLERNTNLIMTTVELTAELTPRRPPFWRWLVSFLRRASLPAFYRFLTPRDVRRGRPVVRLRVEVVRNPSGIFEARTEPGHLDPESQLPRL